MSHHLLIDMERLEKRLMHIAAQVEAAVRRAMTAVFERDADAARDVIDGDDEIDRREVEVEEECLKILALHQPVANDLRFIASCLKINNDLERIGDLACNIASRAISLSKRSEVPIPALFNEHVDRTMAMVRDSLDAFVQADADAAKRVCADDERVDELNREIIHELIGRLQRRGSKADVDSTIELYSVSKHLERVADHATNVAEDVVYMVEGTIIRHGQNSADVR